MEQTPKFESWALLEIMGHAKFAGFLSEQVIGGTSLIRIDVPEVPASGADRYHSSQDAIPAYSKFFGSAAVYCITPVSEEFAREAASSYRSKPHSVYSPRLYAPAEDAPKLIPAGYDEEEDQEDVAGVDEIFARSTNADAGQ